MLGYVVAPKLPALHKRVSRTIAAFKSIALDTEYQTRTRSIHIYRTRYSNNYRHIAESGQIVIATGTLMLGSLRGHRAVEQISNRLLRGERIEQLYGEFRGPYNLLVIDPAADSLLLVTDREGLMPSYELQLDGQALLSSAQLILAALGDPALSELGVQEFVHGGACVGGRTLFRDVHRFPAATLAELAGPQPSSRKLWSATVHSPYLADTDAEIVDKMHGLFTAALRTELADPKKSFATDLTAGTDSRTVLSFLLKDGQPLVASTAGAAGNVDVKRAQEIAARAGIEHFWYPVDNTVEFDQESLDNCVEHCDGAMSPFGLGKQIPYFVEKQAKFDVLFGGNGGPLFKDHYWLFEFNRINKPTEPNWSRIAQYSLTEGRVLNDLFLNGLDYLGHMKTLFLAESAKIKGSSNQKLDFMYFNLKCQYFASSQFAFSNRFMDVYHPMCDGRLVEYSLSIRPWIRQRARLQSELIYRNHKGVAWVLTDNYVPCVPDTGWRSVLRLTRAIRYARAARRKINDFILNKKRATADTRSLSFVESLKATHLKAAFAQPEKLRLAPMLNLQRVRQICEAAAAGAHSGYLQRLFAVEAILGRVEAIRKSAMDPAPVSAARLEA